MDSQKVLLFGGTGLIGSALLQKLRSVSHFNVLAPTSQQLNLLNAADVEGYFANNKPDLVINAAGKSGGVAANIKMPADYSIENTLINATVMGAALKCGTTKLFQYIPACIYPLKASLPYNESSILSGPLEESSKHLAIAKLNALSMAEAMNKQHGTQFISIIPSNIYGPIRKESSEDSHVIPSLLRKMQTAKSSQAPKVEVWGDGGNQRDFLHSHDLADATLHLIQRQSLPSIINVGSGVTTSIADLAKMIQSEVGFNGELNFVNNGLAGAQHKFLDTSIMDKLGWKAQIPLQQGLKTLRS